MPFLPPNQQRQSTEGKQQQQQQQQNSSLGRTSYRPGGCETICLRPMAARLAADLRLSADGSAVRTSMLAGQLQAASVPITQAAAQRSQRAMAQAGTDRRTNRGIA